MKKINLFFRKNRYIILGAIIAALLICLIITLFHFYIKPSRELSATAAPEEPGYSESRAEALLGDSTILVICEDSDRSDITFMCLFDFRVYARSITVSMLSADSVYRGSSYGDCYRYGGIPELTAAVEGMRSCTIDRYVYMNKKGFCDIIDYMGEIEYYVEEDYTYEASDKSNEVKKGANSLDGAMLYTYLRLAAQRASSESEVAEIICSVVNAYLEAGDSIDTQEAFGALCNCVNTDLTVSDYFSAKSDIDYLLTNETVCLSYDSAIK